MYPTHNTFEPAVINTHWFAKIAVCLRTNGCRMEPPIMTPSGNLPQASPCACWLLQCWGKMAPLYTLCAWRRTIKDRWKGKRWMPLPLSDTYRTLRGWVWALCAGGTSGMATHLWEEVGKQDKLRLAALSQQLVEEDWIQLLDFSTCRFVQEIGQQAAHYSLVAHDQDIFLPFKLHDDWFQTMNEVFIGLGCRQNVLSKLDSFICQACTLWNVSYSLILNMCDRMYCAVVESSFFFFFFSICIYISLHILLALLFKRTSQQAGL